MKQKTCGGSWLCSYWAKTIKMLNKIRKRRKKLRNLKEEEGEEEEEGNKGTEGTVGKIVPKNLDIIRLEITEKPVKPKICTKLCKLV